MSLNKIEQQLSEQLCKLDKLYGLSLEEFAYKLKKETGLSVQDILKIKEFELKILKDRYKLIVYSRDEESFNTDEAVELQNIIKQKEFKNQRYKDFISQNNKNKS